MLRDDLIRYCRVVKDMNDPIKVATVGIEKMNRFRAERHKYLCSRYNLTREQTLVITDNLPMEKSVEELAEQYLCGKGDMAEDEFLTSVAFQTLKEVCYRLNEFRRDTSDDVPEEVKKKSYDSDEE